MRPVVEVLERLISHIEICWKGELVATPAFVYAFDNLGPDKFVELCGLLLGARYKGFLLTGPGPDGGVDAEQCPVLAELRLESPILLQDTLIEAGAIAVFQFKHKVVARVGEIAARKNISSLYKSTAKRKSEVLGEQVLARQPSAYILVTNVEINSVFRNSFIKQCKKENPAITHYQVIGLDELESWIVQDRQLRSQYFPTLFGLPKFNLSLKIQSGMTYQPKSRWNPERTMFEPKEKILCLTVMNTGEATSYLSNIKFKALIDGHISYFMKAPIPSTEIDPLANPRMGEPIEPGRNAEFRFPHAIFQEHAKGKKQYFLDSVLVWDQIDNLYTQGISDELRNEIFDVRAETGKRQ